MYTFNTLQRLIQRLTGLRSDAFYVVKHAVERMLGAFVTVESDGKAVYLVLYLCEHMEEFAVGLQSDDLWRKALEKFVGAMAVVFGQSCDRNIEV